MWGTTEQFSLAIGAGGTVQVIGHQLARVSYRRADNWRFFFGGRLLGGTAGVGAATDVYALFDVQVGVGRGIYDTRSPGNAPPLNFRAFCTMHWQVPAGTIPGAQADNLKYTTSVLATPLDDAAPTVRQTIDLLVADNIQCSARMFIDLAPSPVTVVAELAAFFAPNVHVRPDWFADVPDAQAFLGGETKGT
jgi:hypothetical protein